MTKETITKNFIITTFVTLYVMVSIISTIHVIDFFKLSNPEWLAVTLAVAFEVGAAASLASIIALKKMNKGIVWLLFFILTFMQAMGNTYYAFTHLSDYQHWIELFGLTDHDVISQKRILSLVSGAILPVVALGFIKSLVDYMKPEPIEITDIIAQPATEDASLQPQPIPEDIYMVNDGDKGSVNIQDLDAIIKAGQDAQHKKVMSFVAEQHKKRVASGETFDDEPTALANSGLREKAELEVIEETPEVIEPEPIKEVPESNFLDKIKVFDNGGSK